MEERVDLSPPGADRVPPSAARRGGPLSTLAWVAANFEELATALLLAVMLSSVGLSVFFRYALNKPLSWTEEVVLLCMGWLVFLGASMATKHRDHIVIDVVISLVPRRLANTLEVLALGLVAGLLALLVWQGILLLQVTQFVTTTALGIPTMYMYAAVPVSALLMLIHNLRFLYRSLRHGWGG